MFFIEFNKIGEVTRYGTYNDNESVVDSENIIVSMSTLPQDIKTVYYNFESESVETYTPQQLLDKSKYSVLDGIWSNNTMSWNLYDNTDIQWEKVKRLRLEMLQASDWTQLPDVPLATKEAWAAYRQALRDVTLQPDPFNIVWPQPPQ